MKEYNYKEDIKIDRFNLEIAWQEHPENVIKYGELWAEATFERERKEIEIEKIKNDLEAVKSKLDNEARKNWKELEFPKVPTDKAAESWTLLQPSYIEKQEELYKSKGELIDLKQTENKLKIVYYDFCQNQKSALENEVRLLLNEYYSEPKVGSQGLKPKTKNNY